MSILFVPVYIVYFAVLFWLTIQLHEVLDIDKVDESKEGQVLLNKVSAHHEMSRMGVDDQGHIAKNPELPEDMAGRNKMNQGLAGRQ